MPTHKRAILPEYLPKKSILQQRIQKRSCQPAVVSLQLDTKALKNCNMHGSSKEFDFCCQLLLMPID